MLGDECPNDDCYYVPLVRRPKSAGEEEPKKVEFVSFFSPVIVFLTS